MKRNRKEVREVLRPVIARAHWETTLSHAAAEGKEWIDRRGEAVPARALVRHATDRDRNPHGEAIPEAVAKALALPEADRRAEDRRILRRWEARQEARARAMGESVRQEAWELLSHDKVGEFRMEKLARFARPEIRFVSNGRRI